jgi:hypothetical protein
MPHRVLASALLAAGLLAGLIGCESDDLLSPSDYGGWIEGYVTDGDPEDLRGNTVRVEHLAWDGVVTDYTTETDDDGYYRIGVPNGRAVIRTSGYRTLYYREGGVTTWSSDADTLLVDGLVSRADFACGRVRVVVADGLEHLSSWRRFGLAVPVDPGNGWDGVRALFDNDFVQADGVLVAEARMIAPGRYLATARGSGQETNFYLPGTFRPADADSLVITAAAQTNYTTTTPEPASLSGSVLGSWQDLGLAPPSVTVCLQDGGVVLRASCDDAGRFDITLPAAGDFQLVAAVLDTAGRLRSPGLWVGGPDQDSAQVFSLDVGQSQAGIELVEGGLALALPGDPTRTSFTIGVHDADGRPLQTLHYDEPQPAVIAGLAAGRYRLFVDTDGQAVPAFHDGATSLEDATAVEVQTGEVMPVVVTLVAGGRIEGRLVGPDGGPPTVPFEFTLVDAADWASTLVYFRSQWSSLPTGCWYDHMTGEFALSRLTDRAYLLRILPQGGDAWSWYPGVPNWDQATPLVIEDAETVTGLIWQL